MVHSHKMKSYPPLHWLRGWAERIDGLIGLEKPSHYDWMLFRPDSEAVDEMLALGARFAYQMGRIDEYLNHANECYRELLELLPPHSCPHCGESSYLEIQGTILLCDWCGERKELSQVPAHKLENASASFRDALHCLKRVILTTADVVLKAEQTADTSGAQSAIDSLSEKIRLADEMRREAGIDSSKAQELAAGAFLAAQPVKTNPWRDDITRKWNEHDKRQEREAAKRQARSIKMLMEELEAEGIETAGISGEKSMTTNERMLAMLNADKSRTEWSAQKWADELGVSKSAIQKTKAWEMIMRSREAAKQRQAENAVPTWEQ